MFGLSPWKDALVVLLIVLLFFGPKRLPALSRSIGESIKEFKGGIAQATDSEKTELTSAPAQEPVSAPAQEPVTAAGATETSATSAASAHTNS